MTPPVDHVVVLSYSSCVVPSRGVPTVDICSTTRCSTTRSQPQRIVSATLPAGRMFFFFYKFTASGMKLIHRTDVKIWAQQITPGPPRRGRSGSSWKMANLWQSFRSRWGVRDVGRVHRAHRQYVVRQGRDTSQMSHVYKTTDRPNSHSAGGFRRRTAPAESSPSLHVVRSCRTGAVVVSPPSYKGY